jgi:hypothetical protein
MRTAFFNTLAPLTPDDVAQQSVAHAAKSQLSNLIIIFQSL